MTGPVQLELPIAAAPPKVRAHGLRDAHSRPLVSKGKRKDGSFPGSFRVSPQEAWAYPSLELRAGNSWPALVFDVDGPEGTQALAAAIAGGLVPGPNWMVTRSTSGGTHAVYCLARPVHRGAAARQAPLALLARVSERYAQAVGADRGFTAVLSHNPMSRAQRGTALKTTWGERDPYTLSGLADYVPRSWRKPTVPATAVGRNCALFEAGMKWAGSEANLGAPVLAVLAVANSEFETPLERREVEGIARSVERYRRRWEATGRFYTREERQAWAQACGLAGGKASGVSRRAARLAKTAAVVADVLAGMPKREAARKHDLTPAGVRYLVKREAPLLAGDEGGSEATQLVGAGEVSERRPARPAVGGVHGPAATGDESSGRAGLSPSTA